jgi:hypothetical protein
MNSLIRVLRIFVGKNDPHIGVLAAFPGSGWDKLSGKNGLDSRAFSGLWARCKSAVFWQSKREMGVFSTGTEKEGFTWFSKTQVKIERESEPV